jgi:2-phospho-L-lactate guanylyltransferase
MTLWTIVPVKPLRRGKSRLSGVLSEDERTALNQTMLINTLKTLNQVKEIETILVVSRDPLALSIARDYSAKTVLEDGSPELNTALRRAASVAKAYLANMILVLPADLPLIKPLDIEIFLKKAGQPPEIIISPDRRKDGTNALLINPADLIEFKYGPGSFNSHLQNARQKHARIEIFESEVFGLDLDLPEDIELLKKFNDLSLIMTKK